MSIPLKTSNTPESLEDPDKLQHFSLQLSDVIKIIAEANKVIDDKTFIIEYIDQHKIKLVNTDDLSTYKLKINEDGTLVDSSITSIILLDRSTKLGYARQNNLLPGTWVNIYFGGDTPAIITGEITNLEEDMIEIKTYPDDDTLYINFGYKGIPEDLPIESIEIRDEPEKVREKAIEKEERIEKGIGKGEQEEKMLSFEQDQDQEEEELEQEEEQEEAFSSLSEDAYEKTKKSVRQEQKDTLYNLATNDVKDTIREFIIRADEIKIGESLGPITQLVNVEGENRRFNIGVQTEDLLNELLSKIPNSQRTDSVLNNIHTTIERFKQLRIEFSDFDEYGNIENAVVNSADWKPLIRNLILFETPLYWIYPVTSNMKKVYDINESEYIEDVSDIIPIELENDLLTIESIIDEYKSNDAPTEQNKYFHLITELNPFFTPFQEINVEQAYDDSMFFYPLKIKNDCTTIVNNLGNMNSSVVENGVIKTKHFAMNRCNTGIDYLEITNATGSKMETKRVPITQPDRMVLTSIFTLPEPAVRFSRINLPNSNILEKSNLNTTYNYYWKLLSENASINNIIVDKFDKDLNFSEKNFVNKMKNYAIAATDSLSESDQQKGRATIYKSFLNTIVPKTRVLFNLMKKYITGKLSLYDVTGYLEPFLIYTKDLTFLLYKEIELFIKSRISDFNKNFKDREKVFLMFNKRLSHSIEKTSPTKLVSLISEPKLNTQVFSAYNYEKSNTNKTSSELLWYMDTTDFSQIYNNALALINIGTMLPENIGNILDNLGQERNMLDDEIANDVAESDKKCLNIVISKQYNTLEEVAQDNDRITYFDKKFDDTRYSIIDDFQKEQMTLEPGEFYEFLVKKLIDKKICEPTDAAYLAETLINGHKRVIDGDFAIMYSTSKDKMTYFKRNNNKWKQDTTIDESMVVNNKNMMCEFQKDCIEVDKKYKTICETQDLNKKHITENVLKEIVGQFDKKYALSKDKLKELLVERLEYSTSIIDKLDNIRHIRIFKYNDAQYKLGIVEDEIDQGIVSPFVKLRDIIIGQSNFIKKQNDIVQFSIRFTREAILRNGNIGKISKIGSSDEEDINWRYCIKTNTKLLPAFLYTLAYSWNENIDSYEQSMIEIIKRNGVLSDDGDCWVDKHSGYVIKRIDFDIDEGYEEGFKVSSREVLEQDSGDALLSTSTIKTAKQKYTTPETKMMYNIISALSNNMGIDLESQMEFMINIASTTLFGGALVSEADHKKRVEEESKKGKKVPPYKFVYNSTILYLTLGAYLIGIQTSIPSIKTRKTFPGCVRSFTGYPFEGTGDNSSIQYLACVVHTIKNSTDPWSVIGKMKDVNIVEKIHAFIDNYYLTNPDVMQKFTDKLEFLLTNENEVIPEEHDLKNWSQFLPPLVPIKIKQLTNVSEEFKSECLRNFKTGARCQLDKILVIKSKIIFFSLAIQEKIQNIVSRQHQLLLTNAANEPFIENACCGENNKMSTIQYFIDKDEDVLLFNRIVNELSNIIDDINAVTKAPLFFCKENNKTIYGSLNDKYNDTTIYLAFIIYCKFNSIVPISPELEAICGGKPDHFSKSDSITEKIRKLKQEGKQYDNTSFLRLIQLVNRKNIIHIVFDTPVINTVQKIRNVIENIVKDDDDVIPSSMIQRIEENLDTFDTFVQEDTDEMRALKNYLARVNGEMKQEISDFIVRNGTQTKSEIKHIQTFLNTFFKWEDDNDTNIYKSINFVKCYIENILTIFPSIILFKQDFQYTLIKKYWGLSGRHATDVVEMISKYYVLLRSFYDDNAIKNILLSISKKTKNLLNLALNTFYMAEKEYNHVKSYSVFDKRTVTLLFENYFFQALIEYKKMSEDKTMLTREMFLSKEDSEHVTTSAEDLEDVEIEMLSAKNPTVLIGNMKDMQVKTAKLLGTFIIIMSKHKDKIFLSYDSIMDSVFKNKEKEKDTFTDRLKSLTDDEIAVDTILKISKLGVWNKGLQKGLTEYDKGAYEEEAAVLDKQHEIENRIRRTNANVDDNNIDLYMDDYQDEAAITADIDREDNDLTNYLGDDGGEDYDGVERDPDDEYE